jgi:hypothetical protein
MTVTLPAVVTTRQTNWQANPSVTLEAKQETADWVWEVWNAGRLAVPLPSHIERQAMELKRVKDGVFPSTAGKIKEELQEAASETGAPMTGELYHLALARYISPFMFEDIQNLLGMPIIPAEQYMQAAIWKLQGRVATNQANPKASSEAIKAATKDYETTSARKAFNMEA